MNRIAIFALVVCSTAAPRLAAHPVPVFTYDRVVRVKPAAAGLEIAYHLEFSDFTMLRDIDKLLDNEQLAKLTSPSLMREAFLKELAPLLADRLDIKVGERLLTPRLVKHTLRVEDHLYVDFQFVAPWDQALGAGVPVTVELRRPQLREEIHLEKGRLDLGFESGAEFVFTDRAEPSDVLKNRPEVELSRMEEDRLRRITATIAASDQPPPTAAPILHEPTAEQPSASIIDDLRRRGLIALLESKLGVGLLLLLAGAFGAAHALTPGHGKTLVAAYLVGQRGTIGHAFLLGLVTTLTHTGIVILLAALLPLILARIAPEQVQAILGFTGGLLVAGMGVWLLLRRLAGQADHVHVGGGHHHHHGPGGHHHHHHLPTGERVRVWDLIVLGVSGGIVPCWDAIALLAMAIGTRQIWLGLPLLLSFSAGLAGVLVLIGILVVKVRGFGASRRGEGRLIKALPILSAIAVTLLGLWLCFDAVRAG